MMSDNPQAVGRALRKTDQESNVPHKDWTLPPDELEMTDMGRAYGTYSEFRAQGWTDDQMLAHGYARRRAQPTESSIYQHAAELAALARKMGFIVTIEQVSDQPPAMGKHHDVVTVREEAKRLLSATSGADGAHAAQSGREKLLRAALDAADKWVSAEHLHTRDIGKGGRGDEKAVVRAENAARKAITAITGVGAHAASPDDLRKFDRETTEADHSVLNLAATFSTARQFGREFNESGLLSFVDALGACAVPDEAMGHSPLPWKRQSKTGANRWRIVDADGRQVADINHYCEKAEANMALILAALKTPASAERSGDHG